MAVQLKKTYELLALKVSLRAEGRRTDVLCELESNEGGVPEVRGRWPASAESLGLPRYLPSRGIPAFQLPGEMVHQLAEAIGSLPVPASAPLWLHLVKPYGFLGIVPWETLLVPALGRPVLRLPDFLERPRENRSVLDIAICCSAPLSEPVFSAPDLLAAMVGVILRDSPRPRTSVHIFGDADAYDSLRDRLAGEPRVALHEPDTVSHDRAREQSRRVGEYGTTVRCPWLLWIQESMRGRSLDTVHFVGHGYLAGDRPALALAETPWRNRDQRSASFVGVSELATFLTQTGAWSAAFTTPPNNYSEAGSRLLADTLAQTRPGPVLLHDLSADPSLEALGAAYRFLFAPEATTPEPSGSGFVYCQPELVKNQELRDKRSVVPAYYANESLFTAAPASESARAGRPRRPRQAPQAKGAGEGTPPPAGPPDSAPSPDPAVPNWLAAAQRYVEDVAFDVQRRQSNPSQASQRKITASNTAAETLEELQKVVADFAKQHSRDTA